MPILKVVEGEKALHLDYHTQKYPRTFYVYPTAVLFGDVFAKYRKYFKWNLFSIDKEVKFIDHCIYLTNGRDWNGLRRGEKMRELGYHGLPLWEIEYEGKYYEEDAFVLESEKEPVVRVVPLFTVGVGREIELDKARAYAKWPDAELEDFTEEKLKVRFAELTKEFLSDMEELFNETFT